MCAVPLSSIYSIDERQNFEIENTTSKYSSVVIRERDCERELFVV